MTSTLEQKLTEAGYNYTQLIEESEHLYKGEHAFLRRVELDDGTSTLGISYRPGGPNLYGLPYFAEERRLARFKRAFRRGKGSIFKNGATYRFTSNKKNFNIPEEPPLVVTQKLHELKTSNKELLERCINKYRANEVDTINEDDLKMFLTAMESDVSTRPVHAIFNECMSWYIDVADGGVVEHDECSISITPQFEMNALQVVAEHLMLHDTYMAEDRDYPIQEYIFFSPTP